MPEMTPETTVAEYYEYWMEETVYPYLEPATIANYDVAIRLHIGPAVGELPLNELTPRHVRLLAREMLERKGLATSTVRCTIAALSSALMLAAAEGLIVGNPASKIRLPTNKVKRPALDPKEIGRFIREAMREDRGRLVYRYGPMIVTSLTTGMRYGELAGLRWNYVDLERGRIAIVETYTNGVWKEPKSSAGYRTMGIPKITLSILRDQVERVSTDKIRRGTRGWENENIVFPTSKGRPPHGKTVNNQLRLILESAGIYRELTLHCLRHSFVAVQLEKGANLVRLQRLLGHKRMSTTTDQYGSALTETMADDAAGAFDDLLGEGRR